MRPSNWSVLGRSSDPTPGDPVAVRAGGTRYIGIADAISRAAATMRSLEAGVSNVDSVKALLESRDKVVDSVGVAEGRYRAAGHALTAYAAVLDTVQADTLQALHAAKAAAGDGGDAADDQASYHKKATEAKAAGDVEEQDRWEKKEAAAKADAAHAASVVAAQKCVVEQAVTNRDTAARNAIEAITASTSNDGLNDTWWDDWGAELTEWIAKIAEAIATIAGILALLVCWIPVIGQALAGVLLIVAAVAGIVAALANIILAATGEKSWGEAIMSVVFAVLGCVGLGSLRGALGGLKAAFGAWKTAGGLAAQGGLKGLLAATGRNALDGLKGLISHFRPSEAGAADGLVDDVARTGDDVASARPRMGDTHPSDGFGMAPGETHVTMRDYEIRPPTDAEVARLDELAKMPDSPIVKIDGQFHLKDSIDVKFDSERYFRDQPFSAADEYAPGVTYGDEYSRQVNLQQNGMNDLTVGEWTHNVDHYAEFDRLGKSEQAAARAEAGGQPGDFKAVLHGPDQVAGGRPNTFDGLGHLGINSSLGSQWKSLVSDLQADVAAGIGGIDSELLRFVHLNVRLIS
ncbi:MAG: hypothetical protein CVT62_06655 [Actinobacteria bacterium HGW-Actinobacteria-2]|nr:MAG: hypothetical protein CVT62_06655 [Actinobacteria bacterium HGW-Actinobacteria-2]